MIIETVERESISILELRKSRVHIYLSDKDGYIYIILLIVWKLNIRYLILNIEMIYIH
jgi:hypothetical protein